MRKIFTVAISELWKIKKILLIVAVITIISIGLGFYLSVSDNQFVLEMKNNFLDQIENFEVLNDISNYLVSGQVVWAIMVTFLFNLVSGAFISTTLTGIIFPLPLIIAIERGVLIGLVYGGIQGNWIYTILLAGTFVLEFSAYIISSATGINIGLSLFNPRKFRTNSSWKAFVLAWKQAIKIYPLVVVLLLIGAIWEIGGIYLFIK